MTLTGAKPSEALRPSGELSAVVILGALVALIVLRDVLARLLFDGPAVKTWVTIFVTIWVQAMPSLVLGVVISGAIAAFVPSGALPRALPTNPALAVPVAGAAGVALPGCECGSVPIAGRPVAKGAAPAAALTFLLAAPAINPVVIVTTAVAFPGQPDGGRAVPVFPRHRGCRRLGVGGARPRRMRGAGPTPSWPQDSQFSLTSRLVFLVVGPRVDVQLVAPQSGVFGRPFAARFAPLTLMVAVIVSVAMGLWLL